ncbi:MAG: glycosyltransferase family 2 protein [Chitinophagaceae bacterium]|nr:glycosyltransferase family 2 protein [Chitinophagaceae bacterium]MCB9046628.1 glycosyltransferase family 2 protein [Chitinophagales bacterium]
MNISVVIPAYNAAGCIEHAILSCKQQTLQPYEIIVVDDHSTDDTLEIVKQFSGITIISLPVNSGPSAARNRGWDAAKGDIIAFLDSDDTWTSDKLEIISKVFTEHKEIQYMGHPYTVSAPQKNTNLQEGITPLNYSSVLLRNPFQPSCIALRRSLSERFDETYRYCEDHELSIRVAHKYGCHWLNLPLTVLGRPQLSSGGASGNIWKMRRGELRLYSSIYRHNPAYVILTPFLWLFSLSKMLYRLLFKSV